MVSKPSWEPAPSLELHPGTVWSCTVHLLGWRVDPSLREGPSAMPQLLLPWRAPGCSHWAGIVGDHVSSAIAWSKAGNTRSSNSSIRRLQTIYFCLCWFLAASSGAQCQRCYRESNTTEQLSTHVCQVLVVAWGNPVPRLGIEPRSLHFKCGVLATGPSGKSCCCCCCCC